MLGVNQERFYIVFKMLRGLVPTVRRVRLLRARYLGALTDKPPAFASQTKATQSSGSEAADISLEKLKFEDVFNASSCKDIHDVREGGYVDLDANEINKIIPEGLAGELDDEFDFTGRMSWMVRDSGKFLCRVIEEFEASKKSGETDASKKAQSRGFASPINLSGLTDRPEWPDAKVHMFRLGTEVVVSQNNTSSSGSATNQNGKEGADLKVVRGDGSVVEGLLSSVRASNEQKVPTKIVLTGKFPSCVSLLIYIRDTVLCSTVTMVCPQDGGNFKPVNYHL